MPVRNTKKLAAIFMEGVFLTVPKIASQELNAKLALSGKKGAPVVNLADWSSRPVGWSAMQINKINSEISARVNRSEASSAVDTRYLLLADDRGCG
jgi:hypothetical protein